MPSNQSQITSADLDDAPLRAMYAYIEGLPGANVHDLLVLRHGSLVLERYWLGADEAWGRPVGTVEHGPDVRHDLRSITKSIVALLVGIALGKGILAGLDEPVLDYLPDLADLRTAGRERITLWYLLTMTAGLEWDELGPKSDPANSEVGMIRSANPYRFALDRRVVAPPGNLWIYNGGCTELLAAVLSRVTAKGVDAFAAETLFEPLGIMDVAWSALLGSGFPSASSGLHLRPRDLANLGELVLRRGTWGGRQLVPQAWIDEATAAHVGPPDRLLYYGYQWWLGRSLVDGREVTWAAAQGLGGQRLFVVPALDLVVVVTAGHYSDPMQVWLPLVLLNHFVLPAARAAS